MCDASTFLQVKRYAVVTGANKGIGFEICRQLASKGIVVVVTARDEKSGLEAVEKLKESGLSDYVIFHQLDVADPASISSLAHFIDSQFGKLDILVNNAAVNGVIWDSDALVRAYEAAGGWTGGERFNWNELMTQNFEMAEECLKINYYGAKRMIEAHISLLQLSDSARIVNISSSAGLLKNIENECAKAVLNNVENLTEETIDELLNKFMKDFKQGLLEEEGWRLYLSAYTVSKAALNAYTRMLANKYPNIFINCVCPGNVKTDITCNTGLFTPHEGAQSAVNNAAVNGVIWDSDAFVKAFEAAGGWPGGESYNWNELAIQNFEVAEECLKINYYGAKRMIEAHISLLQLSDSARMKIENESAKAVLNNVESITEEKIDELLNKFMKDFKEGLLEEEGWQPYLSACTVSKAALKAYTRMLDNNYSNMLINCVSAQAMSKLT